VQKESNTLISLLIFNLHQDTDKITYVKKHPIYFISARKKYQTKKYTLLLFSFCMSLMCVCTFYTLRHSFTFHFPKHPLNLTLIANKTLHTNQQKMCILKKKKNCSLHQDEFTSSSFLSYGINEIPMQCTHKMSFSIYSDV